MIELAVEKRDRLHEARRRRRMPVLIACCVALMIAVLACAAIGPLLAPYDPNAPDLFTSVAPPSSEHWLGTDTLGRDVLSQVIVGARTAVVGPVLIALGALAIGGSLGLLSGYLGGATDWAIMRWVDLMLALPGLLVAIVVVGVLGGGYLVAVALLIVLTAPIDTRVVRAATLEQRPLPYVEAATTLGLNRRKIMVRHIWPNVMPVVVANSFLNFALGLVTLAGLSFLGLGVGPSTPDWGRMLSENRELLAENAWAALAPGIMLVLTAASMNLMGDRLYEWLSDRGRAR